MRKEQIGTGIGSATIAPDTPATAEAPGHWDITYTCGACGLRTGAALRFEIPFGFTPPQTTYPTAVGYTTVSCTNPDVGVSLHHTDPRGTGASHSGVWSLFVFAAIEEGELRNGQKITLHYGRGNGPGLASEGAFARYFEGLATFAVGVDPDGSRSAPHGGFLLPDTPSPALTVVGDSAAKLFVAAPSIVRPGERWAARATLRDRNDNNASGWNGTLAAVGGSGNALQAAAHSPTSPRIEFPDSAVAHAGVSRVTVTEPGTDLSGVSNPVLCRDSDAEAPGRLYWGDLHVMTEISAGLMRPAYALQYARDFAHLDFCALTDGDDADSYFSDEDWRETQEAVRKFHDPGRFVTIPASEYHERKVAGDKNIYFRNDGEATLLRWSDLDGEQPYALWQALQGRRALTIPHHAVSGSARMQVWDHADPEFMRLVEIYSIWGSSEGEGCPRPNYWRNNYANSVRSALNRGHRLGIIASGDSHSGLAGNCSWMRLRRGYRNGLAAVFASELTREAVFDALYERRCYGTTGARIILRMSVNGVGMGRELAGRVHRLRRQIDVEAYGTSRIRQILVVRNGEEWKSITCNDDRYTGTLEDATDVSRFAIDDGDGNPFAWYYVRVLQDDGEMAWSSPVWIT